MQSPAPKRPESAKSAPSRATIAKVAVIGASAAFVTAKLADVALVGTGVVAAVGSAAFAGFMLMQGDHAPHINGMEYLAIFAKPNGAPRSPEPDAEPSPAQVAAAPLPSPPTIDTAPLGSIPTSAPHSSPPDYELVAAGADHAWVRSGARIISVKPGDTIPDLGKVKVIAWNGGHWTLIGDNGQPMLADNAGRALAAKPLIFGQPESR
jgi:hypothetical protein